MAGTSLLALLDDLATLLDDVSVMTKVGLNTLRVKEGRQSTPGRTRKRALANKCALTNESFLARARQGG